MKYDSSFSILKDILKVLGGDTSKHFDSTYSLSLEILNVLQGGGGSTSEKKAFDGKVALGDYLYYIAYDNIDYNAAFEHFANSTTSGLGGACSLIRMGDIVGRSYDWNISEQVEFVCETPRRDGFYAVKGVSYANITKDNVDIFSDEYKYLPFVLLDGINENGLFICVNQLMNPRMVENISINGAGNGSTVINMQMLTRYLLDRCSSVDEALNMLTNDLHVMPIFDSDGNRLNFHYCIADKEKTAYVYFHGNNIIADLKENDKFVLTNFGLYGTNIIDGQYTEYSNLYVFSQGVARANALLNVEYSDNIFSTLATECKFTNAYTTTDRLDEFVDKTNQIKWFDTDELLEIQQRAAQKYIDETNNGTLRTNADLWQTMHVSLYFLNDGYLKVRSQELTGWDGGFDR